jgi:hypothetical protein
MGYLDGAHPGFDAQQEHRSVSRRISAIFELAENGSNLLVAEDLCLFAERQTVSDESR